MKTSFRIQSQTPRCHDSRRPARSGPAPCRALMLTPREAKAPHDAAGTRSPHDAATLKALPAHGAAALKTPPPRAGARAEWQTPHTESAFPNLLKRPPSRLMTPELRLGTRPPTSRLSPRGSKSLPILRLLHRAEFSPAFLRESLRSRVSTSSSLDPSPCTQVKSASCESRADTFA